MYDSVVSFCHVQHAAHFVKYKNLQKPAIPKAVLSLSDLLSFHDFIE